MKNRENQIKTLVVATAGLALGANAQAQTFSDPLTGTLNPTNWSINQTSAGMYSYGYSSAGLSTQMTGTNPGGLNNINFDLNLAAIGATTTGDFATSVTISNAVLGNSAWDQIQLNAGFQDGYGFSDVYDNSGGYNPGVHVWDGGLEGSMPVNANTGMFTILRSGSTLAGYWNNTLIYTHTETSALTSLSFCLQNNAGSNDPISVTFSNFSFTPAPEPVTTGFLVVSAAALLRRRRK